MNFETIRNLMTSLHRDESGQDLIEYALIAALIALGSVIGMDTVANEINSAFNIISKIGRAASRERVKITGERGRAKQQRPTKRGWWRWLPRVTSSTGGEWLPK